MCRRLSIDEAILVTLLKNTFETRGAKAACLTYRIRERMFQGAKVPPIVLSLLGAKVRGTKVPVTDTLISQLTWRTRRDQNTVILYVYM